MLRRIIPLIFSTATVAATSLLLIRWLIAYGGPEAWSAVAVGQAIGSLAAVALSYGWGLTGPAVVATGNQTARFEESRNSIYLRGAMLLPVLLVSTALCAITSPEFLVLSALGMISTAAGGLSAVWYFIGADKSWSVFLYDALPRGAANLGAIGILALTSNLTTAMFASALGALLGASIGTLRVHLRLRSLISREIVGPRPSVGKLLKDGAPAVGSLLVSTLYNSLPLVIFGLLPAQGLPLFALIDKSSKQALSGLSPIANSFQGWVPHTDRSVFIRRSKRAMALSIGIAVPILVVSSLLGAAVLRWLSDFSIEVSWIDGLLVGALAASIFLDVVWSRSIVAPTGKIRLISQVTILGSISGLALMIALGLLGGARLAVLGIVIGQLIKLAVFFSAIARGNAGEI